MNSKKNRNLAIIVLTLAALMLTSAVVLAAETKLAGTWRGEYSPMAGAPGGAPGGAPRGGAPAGGRGGAPGGAGGAQKITLRLKVNKDKASGNFTMGSGNTDDIHEGKVDGNKVTFKTGLSGQAMYTYEATLDGETLSVTRTAVGGRGGNPTKFSLMRDK